MDVRTHVAELTRHGHALADRAERAGLDAAVPSCPGWDVRALLAHVGMVHRWATVHVREGRAAFAGNADAPSFPAPADGVVDWFRAGHADLVDALEAAPDDLEAMTFLADAGPARAFWARRQAHETAIHGADAAAALGEVPEIDAEFALDGIAELLEGFYARRGGSLRSETEVSLRVVPLGTGTSWLVVIDAAGRTVTRDAPGGADCTVTGRPADLYLDLWNRRPGTSPTVTGDRGVMDLWRGAARVRWR